eukprot:5235224-Pyramimonas_sp.AAC.1
MQALYITRRVVLAGLAFCYLSAFTSIHAQFPGLLGRNGVLPVTTFLQNVGKQLDARGQTRILAFPTLAWLHSAFGLPEDTVCELIALAGMVLASTALILACVTPSGGTMIHWASLWILYLSVYLPGQTFLSFQWDILLLEMGFLAVFLVPLARASSKAPPPLPVMWLLRFLLFKLMLMSGAVKVQASCPTWLHLTALKYHFATQCIPTPLAWWMHQLPEVLLKMGVAATLWLEGPLTWLLLCPLRAPRIVGASLQISLQVGRIKGGLAANRPIRWVASMGGARFKSINQ